MQNLHNLSEITKKIAVLKFEATWCGPCKQLTNTISPLELEYPELQFCAIDIDENPELAKQFQVKKIPTLVILKDGVEQERIIGSSLITPLRTLFNKFRNINEQD